MKQTLLLAFSLTSMMCSSLSHAEFIFHSNAQNTCDNISGHWSGTGKASNWLVGECTYHGSGEVSALDSAGRFTVKVTAIKDSGSSICPARGSETLNAVCSNGVVTIKTEFGNLKGSFSETSGSAKGTLSVSPGLEADVSVRFNRG